MPEEIFIQLLFFFGIIEIYIMNMEIKININIENDIECNVENVVEDDCKMPSSKRDCLYVVSEHRDKS